MSEINVTPLVDVMLVLLIIFMVTAPLLERERREKALQENRDKQQRLIELNLPVLADAPTPPDDENSARVTLSISSQLVVTFADSNIAQCPSNRQPAALSKCLDSLDEALLDAPLAFEYGVTIEADTTVPFGVVVGAMHRLRKAGIEDVGMSPKQ